MPKHYVNGNELFAVCSEWIYSGKTATEQGLLKPLVPEDMSDSILLIAQKLQMKPNSMNYGFLDDMIAEAAYTCLRQLDRFDPAKSMSAFGIITKIMHNTFIRVITNAKERMHRNMFFAQTITTEENALECVKTSNAKNDCFQRWKQGRLQEPRAYRGRTPVVLDRANLPIGTNGSREGKKLWKP